MSWDVLILDFGEHHDLDSIPKDFVPRPLGRRPELIAKLCAANPAADFNDPSWGIIENSDGSVEINTGNDEICESVMLHVRGGNSVYQLAKNIVETLPGKAFDCQSGEFFNPDSSANSFQVWQDYRDKVISDGPPSSETVPIFTKIKSLFNRSVP